MPASATSSPFSATQLTRRSPLTLINPSPPLPTLLRSSRSTTTLRTRQDGQSGYVGREGVGCAHGIDSRGSTPVSLRMSLALISSQYSQLRGTLGAIEDEGMWRRLPNEVLVAIIDKRCAASLYPSTARLIDPRQPAVAMMVRTRQRGTHPHSRCM